MLGNLGPAIQRSVIQQLKNRPKLIVMDTMNFWMETAWDDLLDTLKLIDVLVINDSEARQLSGEYSIVKGAKKIIQMGPKCVVIKKGEHGAMLFSQDNIFSAPALPIDEVFDPTGAGDTFAGGFIGHLARTGDLSFENMKTAVIVGSSLASFCVEKFGLERMKTVTQDEIKNRMLQFFKLANFETYA